MLRIKSKKDFVLGIFAFRALSGKLFLIILFGISISISDEIFQDFIDVFYIY